MSKPWRVGRLKGLLNQLNDDDLIFPDFADPAGVGDDQPSVVLVGFRIGDDREDRCGGNRRYLSVVVDLVPLNSDEDD